MPTIFIGDKAKLPKRRKFDLYQTERTLIRAILREEVGTGRVNILDPGCGDGRWGIEAWKQVGNGRATLTTVDIDPQWNPYRTPELLAKYEDECISPDHYEGNFTDPKLELPEDRKFDYVVGNFPYGPAFKGRDKVTEIFIDHGWGKVPKGVESITTAEIFIRRAWDMLRYHGKIICLLESQFASSMDRYNGLWLTHSPIMQYVCSRRPSFYGRKTNATEFSVFVWKKDHNGLNAQIVPRMWPMQLFTYEREKL